MKYKVTLNQKVYEVEVEAGKAVLLDEYEACAPAPAAAPAAEYRPEAQRERTPRRAGGDVSQPRRRGAGRRAAPAKVDLKAGEPVKSPMPGNIIRVEVKEGDQIKAGQLLGVLEAMKMENEILAPHDGTVAQVIVSKGSTVETDSPLIVLA